MKQHKRIRTNNAFKCSYCNYQTYHRITLIRHTRIHTNEKPFSCEYCNKHFSRQHDLTTHIQSKHALYQNRKYKCKYQNCKKRYAIKDSLLYHYLVHENKNPFICDKCNKSYRSASTLNYHIKQKHS